MTDETFQAILRIEKFMDTVADANPLPREAAEFVHALILATQARRALEIGTSYGYSGLWMAAALKQNGGRLVTIDQSNEKTKTARANIEGAGLGHLVELRTGTALEVIPKLAGQFDFVLNDADKEHCIAYVELLIDKLADRAVVLTDNTLTHPKELAGFLDWIRRYPRFTSAHVLIGNGMEMSVWRGANHDD